jgi:predicted nucleic acid-binding protein
VKPLYLLDTGWIVRHLRGVQAYKATLLKIGAPQLALSILSLGELYEGVYRARDPDAAERAVMTKRQSMQLDLLVKDAEDAIKANG